MYFRVDSIFAYCIQFGNGEPDDKKIGRQSLTDQIVVELRRRIIAGELAEGTPTPEALAIELGVSRIPIREAIRQLEAEGFVQSELHKGTVVKALSLAEIQELLTSEFISKHGCSKWRYRVFPKPIYVVQNS